MKKERIILLLCILGITALMLIANIEKPIISGKVLYIQNTSITKIRIENKTEEILVFEKNNKIKIGCFVDIFGKQEFYKKQKQIIANKIIQTCND